MGTTRTITIKFTGKDAGVSQTITKVSRGLKTIERFSNGVRQSYTQTTREGMNFTRTLGNVEKGLNRVTNLGLNAANSFRLVSQGMMSVGKSLTLFVTPVVVMFFKKAYDAAVNFDSQMIRVQKTTGFATAAMAILGRGIRDMAMNTSTGATELAQIAEQLGQMGIRSVPEILRLTEILNMLSMATDIAADTVGLSIGRLANAFGIDLNTSEGVEDIRRLLNVINELENTMEVKAPEILKGLENFAQVGAILEFPPEIAAAMIASLVSIGFSADEAGTALRNMALKITQNRDSVSALMGATDKYNSVLELTTALNEDFAGTMTDIIRAAGESDDAVAAVAASFDALGIRGGKALTGLAANSEQMVDAMITAVTEMETATSLQIEYERQLLSTENQMKMLKNQFNEFALVVGDTFLPIINTLIATAIPAVRRLIDAFASLPAPMKKVIVAGFLLLAVLGPIILFTSQIGFGLAMMAMSFFRLIQVVSGAGFVLARVGLFFGQLLIGITGLSAGTVLAVLVIGGAIAALLIKLTGLGDKIANFFISLGERAENWGANLIITFGSGMLKAAASFIGKVLTAIGNFIGRFLAGSSPPDMGPLSHIDLWGKNVFDAFLSGFAKADFGILKDVGRRIEKILSTLAKVKLIKDKDQFKFAMGARKDLAKLLSIFKETGKVSQAVLNDITENLGEAADEVQKLIRLWIKYTDIQRQLADLEKRRHATLDTYRQEIQLIAQSTMTAEEKADAIRKSMRARDEELKNIAEEEHALEDQRDIVKEQLDVQKALIDAMQHQDDLQLKLLATLEKLTGKLDDLGDFEFPEIEPFGIPDPDPEDKLGELGETFRTMGERIEAGKKAMEGFFAGLRGEAFDQTIFADLQAFDEEAGTDFANTYETLHSAGAGLHGIWEDINGVLDTARGFFEQLGKTDVKELGDNVGEIADALGIIAQLVAPILAFVGTLKVMAAIKAGGSLIGFLLGKLPILAAIGSVLGNIGAGVSLIAGAFATGGFSGAIGAIGALAGGVTLAALAIPLLVAAIVAGVIWIIRNFDKVKAGIEGIKIMFQSLPIIAKHVFNKVKVAILERWGKIQAGVKKAIDKMKTAILARWEKIKSGVMEKIEPLLEFVTGIWEGIKEAVSGALDTLLELIKGNPLFIFFETAWESIKENVVKIWETIVDTFGPIWERIIVIAETIWARVTEAIGTAWENIKESVIEGWEAIKAWVGIAWDAFTGLVKEKWDNIVNTAKAAWGVLSTAISIVWDTVKAWISTAWGTFRTWVFDQWVKIRDKVILAITPLLTKIIIFWFKIKNAISKKWDEIKKMVGEKVQEVIAKIEEYKSNFIETGKAIIQGIIDGIGQAISGLIEAAGGAASSLLSAIEEALGISSPATAMIEVGQQTMEGLIQGISQMQEALVEALVSVLTKGSETITLWLRTMFAQIVTWIDKTKVKIEEWITMIIAKFVAFKTKILAIITQWLSALKAKITNYKSQLNQAGKDLIAGLKSGFASKIAEVKAWLKQKLKELMSIFKQILRLGSPSTETEQYGVWLMEGLIKGITITGTQLEESLSTVLGKGLETTQALALQGAAVGGGGGLAGATPAFEGGGETGNITLKFGKDSVRSDKDIEEIADSVERVLSRRAEGNMDVAAGFGEDF